MPTDTLSFHLKKAGIVAGLLLLAVVSNAQKAYFIDGYHGGVYGHYPNGYTQFIVDQLRQNPFWKINLEIEPETWDSVRVREPDALAQFQQLFADQSLTGRIEYISPAYGQGYLYNLSGESVIRHFSYGMKKVRQYFPTAVFTTYSSEEPCFTSALPQILTSFGYQYASLKNPNTCWGGYTRAFGGELVNWVGPDGSRIRTVPRYASEGFEANSTWQTEGWINSPTYINDALKIGIRHPVAMTLQDAGWKNGPWIGNGNRGYQPTEYRTWRDYMANVAVQQPQQDWHFSQEDVQVSLVWGSQILQKIAQRVRVAENKVIMAEKIATLNKVYQQTPWPRAAIDEAWRTLMLAQHHDCWIVPYNGRPGHTWADKVVVWTDTTNHLSDRIMVQAHQPGSAIDSAPGKLIRVYNTTGIARTELVTLTLPATLRAPSVQVVDAKNKETLMQPGAADKPGSNCIHFLAKVPAMGYSTYRLVAAKPTPVSGARATLTPEGNVVLETDLYRLVIDKNRGGTVKSLMAKTLGNREFIDAKNERGFNELRGNFFDDGGFHSSTDKPVTVTLLENGPALVKVQISGQLLTHPYTQTIALKQGERKITGTLTIDWQQNVGIGSAYKQHETIDAKDYQKPFYDDSQKLLVLFPIKLATQQLYKDAPFDVTKSKLADTFFTRWDSIKHNLIVNWVDVYDSTNNVGLALLTDHTTSYAHGEYFPLGLNVQYSGAGLWGRNHTLTGPTELRYALVPHPGRWDTGQIATEAMTWNEPLLPALTTDEKHVQKSLVDVTGTGWQVTAVLAEGNDVLVRLFNAEGDARAKKLTVGGQADAAELIELDGRLKRSLPQQRSQYTTTLMLDMPRFGLRTIRLTNFKAN